MVKIFGASVCIAGVLLLQGYTEALELHREQVFSGEIWRLWSGHLVHSSVYHLALNTAAAVIIYLALVASIKPAEVLIFSAIAAPLISISLLHLYPELDWYNGFSGLLHAQVAYICMRRICSGMSIVQVGLAVLWIKVIAETIAVSSGDRQVMGSMNVISEAHWIGAFTGTVLAAVVLWAGWNKLGSVDGPDNRPKNEV